MIQLIIPAIMENTFLLKEVRLQRLRLFGLIICLSIFVQGMEMVAKKEEASAEKAVGLKVLMRKEDPII